MKNISLFSLLLITGFVNCSQTLSEQCEAARIDSINTPLHKLWAAQHQAGFDLENTKIFLENKCRESKQPWFGQSEECFRFNEQKKSYETCKQQAEYLRFFAVNSYEAKKHATLFKHLHGYGMSYKPGVECPTLTTDDSLVIYLTQKSLDSTKQ